jgi:hypothetical protein
MHDTETTATAAAPGLGTLGMAVDVRPRTGELLREIRRHCAAVSGAIGRTASSLAWTTTRRKRNA